MSAGPSSRPVCTACRRPVGHCLCALVPRLQCATEVLILQHPSERQHALNTARLLALGLVSARLVTVEFLDDDLAAKLTDPGWRTELLFPGPDATLITRAPSDARPRRLVLLDGTWRKARKLLYLNAVLRGLPRVTLPSGEVSRYRLRKAPGPEALSTIEAGVRALSIIEPKVDFLPLLSPFEALIEGQISAMGSDCYQRNHLATTR
jgi:DTW domain-containing protein